MARFGNAVPARGVLAQEEPQGVLSGIGQGGLLSGIGAGIQNLRNRQPGQRPILDMLGNNAQSLFQAGIATLMAPTRRMAAQAWQQGMSSGSQVDAYRNKQRADERLQQQREQALAQVMRQYGLNEGMAAVPELAIAAVTQAMKPPEPQDNWVPTTMNGIPGQRNTRDGKFDEFTTPSTPETYRSLITPEERAAAGLAPEDTGPAQISSSGRIVRPSAGGVNVNIGNMTEGQSNANTFAARMENAAPIIDELEQVGTQYDQYGLSQLPLGLGNMAISDDYRRLKRAQDDFVRAALRKESGALISAEDQAYANTTWLPMPGDDPQTLADKREARRVVMESIRAGAGPMAARPLQPRNTTITVPLNPGESIEEIR